MFTVFIYNFIVSL